MLYRATAVLALVVAGCSLGIDFGRHTGGTRDAGPDARTPDTGTDDAGRELDAPTPPDQRSADAADAAMEPIDTGVEPIDTGVDAGPPGDGGPPRGSLYLELVNTVTNGMTRGRALHVDGLNGTNGPAVASSDGTRVFVATWEGWLHAFARDTTTGALTPSLHRMVSYNFNTFARTATLGTEEMWALGHYREYAPMIRAYPVTVADFMAPTRTHHGEPSCGSSSGSVCPQPAGAVGVEVAPDGTAYVAWTAGGSMITSISPDRSSASVTDVANAGGSPGGEQVGLADIASDELGLYWVEHDNNLIAHAPWVSGGAALGARVTISIPGRPQRLAICPARERIFVTFGAANRADGGLAILDRQDRAVPIRTMSPADFGLLAITAVGLAGGCEALYLGGPGNAPGDTVERGVLVVASLADPSRPVVLQRIYDGLDADPMDGVTDTFDMGGVLFIEEHAENVYVTGGFGANSIQAFARRRRP